MRCDADASAGVGHLVRCIALAEELRVRGIDPIFMSDLGGMAWAEEQLYSLGLRRLTPPMNPEELVAVAEEQKFTAIVLDHYALPLETGALIRKHGICVLAFTDGAFGRQEADVAVDQNIGAELEISSPEGGRHLAGAQYAVLRDTVRSLRPASPPGGAIFGTPNVLLFFGGTDSQGAAEAVVPLLLETGLPMSATVVASSPRVARKLAALPLYRGQSLRITPPVNYIAQLIIASDLVVGAAGSSAWELACLGTAMALVLVVDNQEAAYNSILRHSLASGLGRLAGLRADPVAQQEVKTILHLLLTDQAARARLRRRAWTAVDGAGRVRVVDALLEAVGCQKT